MNAHKRRVNLRQKVRQGKVKKWIYTFEGEDRYVHAEEAARVYFEETPHRRLATKPTLVSDPKKNTTVILIVHYYIYKENDPQTKKGIWITTHKKRELIDATNNNPDARYPLPPGTYKLEQILNPYHPDRGYWLVLKGTKIGGTPQALNEGVGRVTENGVPFKVT